MDAIDMEQGRPETNASRRVRDHAQRSRRRSPLAEARAELAFVGGLMDAITDIDALSEPLVGFNTLMRGSNSSIAVLGGHGTSLYMPSHIPLSVVAAYLPRIEEDPWYAAGARLRGEIHALGSTLVPQREYRKSRVYADLNRLVGTEYAILSGNLHVQPQILLISNRTARQRDFDGQDIARMRRLYPHVTRFARLRSEHDALRRPRPGVGIIDIPRTGRAEIDGAAADLLADIPDGWRDGRGPAFTGRDAIEFAEAVRACHAGAYPAREHFDLGRGDARVDMQLRPGRRPGSPGWVARLTLTRSPDDKGGALAGVHLTRAERGLLDALLAGATVAEHAALRKRSIHTVRFQLKALLAKTGCRRQVDLVRRFGAVVGR